MQDKNPSFVTARWFQRSIQVPINFEGNWFLLRKEGRSKRARTKARYGTGEEETQTKKVLGAKKYKVNQTVEDQMTEGKQKQTKEDCTGRCR